MHLEVDPHRGRRQKCSGAVRPGLRQPRLERDQVQRGKRAGEELCGRTHYDAVLVSYRFDGMDGVELIRSIRALDHRKGVSIVMVTGTVGLDVMTAALTAGADAVLYEPIELAILVATVSKCVERSKQAGKVAS